MDSKTAGAQLAAALSVVIPLPDMIDEAGELKRRRQERKPEDARLAWLEEQIEERFVNLPAATPTVAQGHQYTLQISAREWKRTITAPMKLFLALRKQLGLEALVAVMKILLDTVDKFVPESKQKRFLTKERSGARTYVYVPKASPLKAA